MSNNTSAVQLERKLGPWMLWGLGVGYVISGMYFGWNLGLEKGGTLGLAVATLFIIVMYLTFTFSYTELACAIPKAGRAYTSGKSARIWNPIVCSASAASTAIASPCTICSVGRPRRSSSSSMQGKSS